MKGRFDLLPDFFKLTLVFSFYLTMYLVSALVSAGVCQLIYGVNFFDSGAQSFDLSNPTNLAAIKLFQLISSLIVFIGTTGIATYFIAKQPLQFLGLTKMPIALTIILAMATMLLITPFINYTFAMNSMLDLPDWMSSLEKEASGFTEAFLKMKGPGDLIYNLLIIALIPAIGEELLFRGLIQQLLKGMFNNVHLAVLFSAIFFSSMHMQFYGFLPRMILGMVLGYMFVWSGSLWLPIIAHFVNNAATILFSYYAENMPFNQDTIGVDKSQTFILIASVTLCWFMMWGIKIMYEKKDETADKNTLE